MIKAIIFDFDGVLIESVDIKTRAFAYLFRDYPEHVDRIVEFHARHGGISRFEKFDYIYKHILCKELKADDKSRLGEAFSKYVYEEVIKCPFVAGAAEFLKAYHRKMSFFIVSGTPLDELRLIIKARELEKYFVEIFGSPGKKSSFNSGILKKYGIAAQDAVVLGDSIDDYQGAREAGLKFIGRVNGRNPFENLTIEAVIGNIFDLEKILNANQI